MEDVGRAIEGDIVCEKREREEEADTLTPWEQHANVISIPRFDYTAPSSLLHHSHSGFLVTCTINDNPSGSFITARISYIWVDDIREGLLVFDTILETWNSDSKPIDKEKSATKEVMSILGKALPMAEEKAEAPNSCDGNAISKKPKLCDQEKTDTLQETGENPKITDPKTAKESINEEHNSLMSLVKLTRSGLLLFTFPIENFPNTTNIVSKIFQLMESKALKSPIWCHRIFPIQATCGLKEKELQETVSKLVRQFVDDKRNTLSNPVKFAAGYNRRGMEESKGKMKKEASEVVDQCPLLDRSKCFEVVAAGVKSIVPDSAVDLTSPEVCVMVELLPVSRIPSGSYVAAVSVLPQRLVSTKPKLCIKSLVPETKQKKGDKKKEKEKEKES